MKKDKLRVEDEVWTPERIISFLDLQPPPGLDADAYVLLRSYRSMRAEDFKIFVAHFIAAGRDLNARGSNGKSLLQIISRHRNSTEYVATLEQYLLSGQPDQN